MLEAQKVNLEDMSGVKLNDEEVTNAYRAFEMNVK